mgnify:CR=1 FL=1
MQFPPQRAHQPSYQHDLRTQPLFFADLAPVTVFRELPATGDALRRQQARNFMMNTLNAFVWSPGTSSLLDVL